MHTWLDKYSIVFPQDSDHLHATAAVNEFQNKMPKEEAEKAAHQAYVKKHAAAAAAHHLLGMKAAHSIGHLEESKKHAEAYEAAMKVLGANVHEPPPPEVHEAAKNLKAGIYRFVPHDADALFEEPGREK